MYLITATETGIGSIDVFCAPRSTYPPQLKDSTRTKSQKEVDKMYWIHPETASHREAISEINRRMIERQPFEHMEGTSAQSSGNSTRQGPVVGRQRAARENWAVLRGWITMFIMKAMGTVRGVHRKAALH